MPYSILDKLNHYSYPAGLGKLAHHQHENINDPVILNICDLNGQIMDADSNGWARLHTPSSSILMTSFCDHFGVDVSWFRNLGDLPVVVRSEAEFSGISYRFEHILQKENNGLEVHCVSRFCNAALALYEEANESNRVIAELQKKLDRQSKVLAVLAHDLRAPVASISSYTSFLEGNESNPELKAAVATVKQQLLAIDGSINDLLTWATRLFKGGEVEVTDVDLALCVEDAVSLHRPIAAAKGIEINNNVKTGELVLADRNLVSIAISNVLSNAIKFTPVNGAVVISSLVVGDRVLLSVVDSGQGMTMEQMGALFTQSHSSSYGTNGERGFGMGLRICKEYMELNKGALEIESNPGEGTTITLAFQRCC